MCIKVYYSVPSSMIAAVYENNFLQKLL